MFICLVRLNHTISARYDLYPTINSRVTPLAILQQTCYQQDDIRIRSHGLRQLVDARSVLKMTSCDKPDFNKFVGT